MTLRDDYEKGILTELHESDMTFTQGAELLNVSTEKIKEMFTVFNWIPSSVCMQEIYEIEREVMRHIDEESRKKR
jgi:hypothetical protein